MNLKNVGTSLLAGAKKHSPEILTGIGVGGFITAIVFAVKATPKACELIEEKKLDTGKEKLTKREIIKTTWKCYVPTVITAGTATACIIGAAVENNQRNAALAAAYSLSQETMQIYKQKVIETIGEKKEAEIREKTDQEQFNRRPPQSFEVNPIPPDTLCCYEERYFYNNWDNIRAVVNDLGEEMLNNPFYPSVTLNDFFEGVNLPPTTMGDRLAWDLHLTGRPELYPPTCIEMPNHQICFVISFRNPPIDIYNTRKKRSI